MAVTINAKGTSLPYFGIGKKGITLYQGDSNPANAYTVKSGDYWLDTSTNSIKVRSSVSTWVAPGLSNLDFTTNTVSVSGVSADIPINLSSKGAESVFLNTNGLARLQATSAGNIVVGSGALATSATDGFLYVTGAAGVPNGTPTSFTGRSPLVVDTTNGVLYFYTGSSWKSAGGGGTGTVTSVEVSGGTTGLTTSGGPVTSSGTITLAGTLAVVNGGTGATVASTARSNLSAAASGANSDITSISGLTTALTVSQGGTGATTANTAFNNLVPSQVTNGGKFLTTDGTNTTWAAVSAGGTIVNTPYDQRAVLRTVTGTANTFRYVESLGTFSWNAGSLEPDDDETAFASTGGVWLMATADPEYVYASQLLQDQDLANASLLTFTDQRTFFSSTNGAIFTVPDNVFAIRAYVFGAGGGGAGGACTWATIPTTPGRIFNFTTGNASSAVLSSGGNQYLVAANGAGGVGGARSTTPSLYGMYDAGSSAGGAVGASGSGGASGSPLGTGGAGGANVGGGGGWGGAGGFGSGGTAGGGGGVGGAGANGSGNIAGGGGGAGGASSSAAGGISRSVANAFTDPLLRQCISPGGSSSGFNNVSGGSAGPGGGGGGTSNGGTAGSGGLGGGGGGSSSIGGAGGFGGGGGHGDSNVTGGGVGGVGGGGGAGAADGPAGVMIFY